jgi:hypothetical protein
MYASKYTWIQFYKKISLLVDLKALEEQIHESVIPLMEVYIHETAIIVAGQVSNMPPYIEHK